MDNLYLIGIDKEDIDGKKRLDDMLSNLSPKKIVVGVPGEISRIFFDKEKYTPARKFEEILEFGFHPKPNDEQKKSLMEIFNMHSEMNGYECIASLEYCKKNNASLKYIGRILDDVEKDFIETSYINYPFATTYDIRANKAMMDSLKKDTTSYIMSRREYSDYSYTVVAEFLKMWTSVAEEKRKKTNRPKLVEAGDNKPDIMIKINKLFTDAMHKKSDDSEREIVIDLHRVKSAFFAQKTDVQRYMAKMIEANYTGEKMAAVLDYTQVDGVGSILKMSKNPPEHRILMLGNQFE